MSAMKQLQMMGRTGLSLCAALTLGIDSDTSETQTPKRNIYQWIERVLNLGHPEKAAQALMAVDGSHRDVLWEKAHLKVCEVQENHREALESCHRLILLGGENGDLRLKAARHAKMAHREKEAEAHLRIAMNHEDSHIAWHATLELSRYLMDLQRYEEAEALARKAVEGNGDDPRSAGTLYEIRRRRLNG